MGKQAVIYVDGGGSIVPFGGRDAVAYIRADLAGVVFVRAEDRRNLFEEADAEYNDDFKEPCRACRHWRTDEGAYPCAACEHL